MANRGITNSVLLEEVGKNSVEYYELVHIDIGSGYYITNAPYDLDDGIGNTYTAMGTFLSFGDVEENVTFEVAGLPILISGLPAYDDNDEKWTSRILDFDNNPYSNKLVTIKRKYLFPSTTTTQPYQFTETHVIEIYKGYIDSAGMVFDPTGTSTVELDTKSHWVDFNRSNGQYTNTNTHKKRSDLDGSKTVFDTDEGFAFSSAVIKDIEWKTP